MFGLGLGEILIILIFSVIFLGPKRLPGFARTLGRGLRDITSMKNQVMNEFHKTSFEEYKNTTNPTKKQNDQEYDIEDVDENEENIISTQNNNAKDMTEDIEQVNEVIENSNDLDEDLTKESQKEKVQKEKL